MKDLYKQNMEDDIYYKKVLSCPCCATMAIRIDSSYSKLDIDGNIVCPECNTPLEIIDFDVRTYLNIAYNLTDDFENEHTVNHYTKHEHIILILRYYILEKYIKPFGKLNTKSAFYQDKYYYFRNLNPTQYTIPSTKEELYTKAEQYIEKYNVSLGLHSFKHTPYYTPTPKPQPNIPKCPICNSTNLQKISFAKKAGKIGLFGIFGAGDIGKTYKCKNCGAKF